jgi:hypothetical protein
MATAMDQVSFDEFWALQKALKNAEAKVAS